HLRGPGSFVSSAKAGHIWFRSLPDGEPFQLTKTLLRKQTINFSQDGSRLFFTQLEGQFAWNTYELPLLGAQEPKLFMANATGLSAAQESRLPRRSQTIRHTARRARGNRAHSLAARLWHDAGGH